MHVLQIGKNAMTCLKMLSAKTQSEDISGVHGLGHNIKLGGDFFYVHYMMAQSFTFVEKRTLVFHFKFNTHACTYTSVKLSLKCISANPSRNITCLTLPKPKHIVLGNHAKLWDEAI